MIQPSEKSLRRLLVVIFLIGFVLAGDLAARMVFAAGLVVIYYWNDEERPTGN